MKTIETTLFHISLPPRRPVGEKPPAVLLLHGRGADEEDLLGLSEFLDDRVHFISARAPFSFAYGGGYTWYDVLEVGKPEPAMFTESYTKLLTFLDEIRNGYNLDAERIYLAGFSMGTIMSHALALTKPEAIAGVMGNSGYIPEDAGLAFAWEKIAGKPFLVTHGTYDPVIPVEFGRRTNELLVAAKADVTYREFPIGHAISDESLEVVAGWLKKRLGD